jgi:nicotinamide-nucleotide amidase
MSTPASTLALSSADVGDRTVAVAESCTGGLVGQALAQIEGSGDWFRGGLVAYHRNIKYALLGVDRGPVVNERAARQMARGAAALFGATATIGLTGAAGPDPQDGAEPGTVVIATYVDGAIDCTTHHFVGDPGSVCEQARAQAIAALTAALRSADRRVDRHAHSSD